MSHISQKMSYISQKMSHISQKMSYISQHAHGTSRRAWYRRAVLHDAHGTVGRYFTTRMVPSGGTSRRTHTSTTQKSDEGIQG